MTNFLDDGNLLGEKQFDLDGEMIPVDCLSNVPPANITEKEKKYLLELAVPGLDKKDFKIELGDEVLSVSVNKKTKLEKKNGGIYHKEFLYDKFCRSFRLPENADVDNLQVSYENGILKIEIPKKEIEVLKSKKEIALA
ncbi:MAG: Hsp20/alpha crystallin family protein [Bacteroidetes bacterium]|nr:Hsp20/alpha crystallin family protein [Bacteroidota bacterium]